MWRRWQRDEAFRIQVWYGHLIISGTAPRVELPRIEVAAIADLAYLAQRTGSLIMRNTRVVLHQYLA
ncbi:MAG: hypothetical protein K6356_11125 [Chloroflexus sp.]